MDPERAKELLARERSRIEQALGIHTSESGALESDANREPGDEGSEDLLFDEIDQGRTEDLRAELAAVERAEARLRDGTFGRSVVSGDPIPEGRLEARPTAETTVEEQQDRQ
jgi:DnaK suppressor protein